MLSVTNADEYGTDVERNEELHRIMDCIIEIQCSVHVTSVCQIIAQRDIHIPCVTTE